jgi:hypothetical protein
LNTGAAGAVLDPDCIYPVASIKTVFIVETDRIAAFIKYNLKRGANIVLLTRTIRIYNVIVFENKAAIW